MKLQTQEQANAYWSDKEYKKWVVVFTAGSRRRRLSGNAIVGAATSAGARRAGIAAMAGRGHTWVRSAAATVRLATAQDLGCVATGGKDLESGRPSYDALFDGSNAHLLVDEGGAA